MDNNDNAINTTTAANYTYSVTDDLDRPRATMSRTEITQSPLPSPEILKGYAELIPNGAERFMSLLERAGQSF